MPEVTASGAEHAARQTFDKTITVAVEIFVPIGAAVAGFFMPTVLGGGSKAGDAIYQAAGNTQGVGGGGLSAANAQRAGWAVQALINAAVGAAFWSLRHHSNIIAKVIGNAVGGFFLGGAAGCLPGLFSGSHAPPGLIDSLAGGIQSIATDG